MSQLIFCLLFVCTSLNMAFMPASDNENELVPSLPSSIQLKKKPMVSEKKTIQSFATSKSIHSFKKTLQHKPKRLSAKQKRLQNIQSKQKNKQLKKQFRKSLWKIFTNKAGGNSVHWSGFASLISGAVAVGILGIGLAVGLASSSVFSFLVPFALLLALFGLVVAFVGIFKSTDERFRGGMTLTYSIIGGVLSFLYLAFIALVIIAIASISF